MTHGRQRDVFDLTFSVPAECADRVARGEADLGILPVAEIQRQALPYFTDVGITCTGPVRSILLVSKTKPEAIQTLAADSSSRTSVMLARVILGLKYGVRPKVRTHRPELERMLAENDAALIIGDPALRLDTATLAYPSLDLGAEWTNMTGLPMVFALWSGPYQYLTEDNRRAFQDSCQFGLDHLDDIVRIDAAQRGFTEETVRTYLTRHIQFQLGADHRKGLELFLRYVREFDS